MNAAVAVALAVALAAFPDERLAAAAGAAAPASVTQWARFEASYEPDVAPTNPFDPDEIDVRAQFESPDGRLFEVLGFWNQDYTRALVNDRERLTAVGTPHFTVRFTPDLAGTWSWWWVIRQNGQTQQSAANQLDVQPAEGHGFLRLSSRDRRYLAFDDGAPYFAVGENTAWYGPRGTYDYDDWFAQLQAQQANYARLWMPSWAFGIEWSDTGLGNYTNRLGRAWQLDQVLDEAEQRGIYVMLSLLNHGAFSTHFDSEWAANPYNAANGGPLASPADFFSSAEAQQLFARRLRYIVARWGWSTHVLAWELWNEVELTDGYGSAAVTAWHAQMSALLRSLDPYRHLVTTSFALSFGDANVWSGGGLDFTQFHYYANVLPQYADLSKTVVSWTAERYDATQRPVLFGELGIGDRDATLAADPDGIGLHDGLWAAVVSGGMGTAMTWWWDNLIALYPDVYYPMFGAVARFVDGIEWDRKGFTPFAGELPSAAGSVLQYGLRGGDTLLLWIKDDAYQWNSANARVISDATLHVPGICSGRWYDPWSGEWLGSVELRGEVPVPPFSRDLALRATCATACAATGCKSAGRSLLRLKHDASDGGINRLVWKWQRGAETTLPELADPTAGTQYTLCVQSGTSAAWVNIPAGSNWRRLGTKGFEFRDPSSTPEGAYTALLSSGSSGRARAIVKAEGPNLPGLLAPPLSLPVIAQLSNGTNGTCFESLYDGGDVIGNDSRQFRAKTR